MSKQHNKMPKMRSEIRKNQQKKHNNQAREIFPGIPRIFGIPESFLKIFRFPGSLTSGKKGNPSFSYIRANALQFQNYTQMQIGHQFQVCGYSIRSNGSAYVHGFWGGKKRRQFPRFLRIGMGQSLRCRNNCRYNNDTAVIFR